MGVMEVWVVAIVALDVGCNGRNQSSAALYRLFPLSPPSFLLFSFFLSFPSPFLQNNLGWSVCRAEVLSALRDSSRTSFSP